MTEESKNRLRHDVGLIEKFIILESDKLKQDYLDENCKACDKELCECKTVEENLNQQEKFTDIEYFSLVDIINVAEYLLKTKRLPDISGEPITQQSIQAAKNAAKKIYYARLE